MQRSFFKILGILEESSDIYESPYKGREIEQAGEEALKEEYMYYLNERLDVPENTAFIHDYAALGPVLSISEVEEIVSRMENENRVKAEQASGTWAAENRKTEKPCKRCMESAEAAQEKDQGAAGEQKKNFKSAKNLLSSENELPKKENKKSKQSAEEETHEDSNVEKKFVQMIQNEVMVPEEKTSWEDIAGLESIKNTIKEIIIWPMVRPDIFKGLRGPPKALLLFGPPGTGKTLIGKCIASQSKSTFFSISASSLTSKWMGEGEKMVRALFHVAASAAPAVVFIDEIDSLLMQRTEGENESTRRIKTEFLVQMDGAKNAKGSILVIGATNRPQEIDEAARRRFVKRLYVPLPDLEGRKDMIRKIGEEEYCLSGEELEELARSLEGYSGSDIFNLCREAAMEPVREVKELESLEALRSITLEDFRKAMQQIRMSVSAKDLEMYEKWNRDFGSLN